MEKEALFGLFQKSKSDTSPATSTPIITDPYQRYLASFHKPADEDYAYAKKHPNTERAYDTLDTWWDPKKKKWDDTVTRAAKIYATLHQKYPKINYDPDEFSSSYLPNQGAHFATLYNQQHKLTPPDEKAFKTKEEYWKADDDYSAKCLNDEMYKFRDLRHFSPAQWRLFNKYMLSLTPKQIENYKSGKFPTMNKKSFEVGFMKASADWGVDPLVAINMLKKAMNDLGAGVLGGLGGTISGAVGGGLHGGLLGLPVGGIVGGIQEAQKEKAKHDYIKAILGGMGKGGLIGGGIGAVGGGVLGGLGGAAFGVAGNESRQQLQGMTFPPQPLGR